MRSCALASISSRVPKCRQSAGHALTHAGVRIDSIHALVSSFVSAVPLRESGAGWLVRSAQCVHFSIFGARLSHSAVGTPHGHAHTQYRQPMHLSASYVVGPSGCRLERRRRTGRLARRLEAVEAPAHREDPREVLGRLAMTLALDLVRRDERQRLGAQRRRVLETELAEELGLLAVLLVPLLAGHLAGAAADALRDVDERRLDGGEDGGRAHAFLAFEAAPGAALTTFTRQAFVSWVPAPGSFASIVRWFTLTPVESPWKPQL